MEHNTSGVLKWSLVIGIVLVLNLFIGYGVSVLYQEPQYENFCPASLTDQTYNTQAECLAVGGQWNQTAQVAQEPTTVKGVTAPGPQVIAYCNATYSCETKFESAQQTYDRNVFASLVVIGVILIVLGFAFKANDVLSYGFSLGGVLSFLIASVRYWSSADNLVKLIILAAALAALIYLAYKKFTPAKTAPRTNETLRP